MLTFPLKKLWLLQTNKQTKNNVYLIISLWNLKKREKPAELLVSQMCSAIVLVGGGGREYQQTALKRNYPKQKCPGELGIKITNEKITQAYPVTNFISVVSMYLRI